MLESNTRCWVEIDLGKIKHNVDEIHKLIPKSTKIMAIVKANGYGHGDVEITKALMDCGVDFFGVSSIDEAISLRVSGICADILILGYTPSTHFHYLHEMNLIQTMLSYDYAHKLQDFAYQQDEVIRTHIKIDTGMSRLGVQCKCERWDIEEVKEMYHLSNIQVEGVFSHFSVSDVLDKDEDVAYTNKQIALYDQVLQELKDSGIEPGLTHLQNTYGILNHPELQYDYVRPGLLHLGVTSNDALVTNQQADFRPIMTWCANVSYIKTIEKGSCVSYGRHFTAQHAMRIATISCGYADGYPRFVSNKHKDVLIHGIRAQIVGNVCMDQMMVDVSHIDHVVEGDSVVLFGYDGDTLLPMDELSRACNTINNETLCWISARVPRLYKK